MMNLSLQSMTMEARGQELNKMSLAKRVSFDDIDEDVLERFIKVKSKYITDGQVSSIIDVVQKEIMKSLEELPLHSP
jgi:hypothetical protein